MARTRKDPDQQYSDVVAHFAGGPGVTCARMLGADGLKTDGKVFAMLVGGRLVVKLPAARCDEIIKSSDATRFDPGHGRLMREWVSVPAQHAGWLTLASEAKAYVETVAKKKTKRRRY